MADEVRLIDANALKESLKKYKVKGYNHKYVQGMQDAIDGYFPRIIDDAPTIEAEPVKHGRWIKHRIDDPKSILHGAVKDTTCSVCGKSTPYNTEYCMHCGARMDGDNNG